MMNEFKLGLGVVKFNLYIHITIMNEKHILFQIIMDLSMLR